METKQIALEAVQLKADGDGQFAGYASVFGGLDSYGDTIEPGAYEKTLENRDRPIRMRWNHYGPVVGKYTEIKEDDTGLWVRGELTPGHSVAEDVYASLKHGAIDGLSIGYRVRDYDMDGNVRRLKEIDLVEISVVEEPADLGARVGDVKDHYIAELIEQVDSLKDAEAMMREAFGLSRGQATSLVSRIKRLGDRGQEKTFGATLEERLKAMQFTNHRGMSNE